jgi:hypothetical protein
VTRDQELVIGLLCGNSELDKRGLPDCRYPVDGSEEELAARRALARMLRSSRPIHPGVLSALADLIDPDRDEINRQIRFVNRRKGKPSKAAVEKKIAEFIRLEEAKLGKTEAAIASAEKEFGLKRARLFKIWGEWKPVLEGLKRQ